MSIEELKRENEILKDALCMEQDRLSHARHHIQNAQDRIKQLETENDAMRADLLLWNEKEGKL